MKKILFILGIIISIGTINASLDINNQEIVIPIEKGWNLIPAASMEMITENSQIKVADFKYGYIYDVINNNYIYVLKNGQPIERDPDLGSWGSSEYILRSTLWVYSIKPGEFRLRWGYGGFNEENFKLRNYNLIKGWNFLYVTPFMDGVSYEDFKGNCPIEKICFYNNKKWDCKTYQLTENIINTNYDIGKGFVIKVSNDCKLGGIFPEKIENYKLISINDNKDNGCQIIDNTDSGIKYNLRGEICFNTSRVEYKEENSNKGAFISLMKIPKGKDLYRSLLNQAATHLTVGKYNLLTMERWEYVWFSQKKYDLIITQQFIERKSTDGSSTSYDYQNATIDNPVIKYFLDKYPPQSL